MDKVNPIIIKDENGEDKYRLEFSRESIRYAEENGFDITKAMSKLVTTAEDLFFYAFRMHHKGITRETTNQILTEVGIGEALMNRLVALYNAPIEALMEGKGKNAKYAITM